MEMTTREETLAKRRAQNREAQRRFRWKQSQQKERNSIAGRKDDGASTDQLTPASATTAGATLNSLTMPEPVTPPATMLADDRSSECFFTSKLSLFGNYALLDFFDMDGVDEVPTNTAAPTLTPPVSVAAATLSSSQTARVANENPMSLAPSVPIPASQHRPLYSRSDSQDATQTAASGFNPITTPSTRFRAYSRETQDRPISSSSGSLASPSVSMSADTASSSLDEIATPYAEEMTANRQRKKDQGWQSPLHLAAQKGHDRIVRVLLQHQSDCNERDSDGLTPLFHAIISGHEHVVVSLLEHGARISDEDEQGRTALTLAVVHRREALLKILLQHCAGNQALIDGYDAAGRTPLHTAIDIGFETGVRVLLEYGANLNHRTRKA